MKSSLASVLLPVYNAVPYLEQAVRSVLNQTYSDFEFVIVDDGSTDGSDQILARLASEDHRIRLITQENQGLIRTLNRAVHDSNGELLFRMDADDICESDRFEKQIEYLDSHPECVAVGMSVKLIDTHDRNLRVMTPPLDHESIDAMGLIGLGAAISHPTVAMRRNAFDIIGGYHEEYPHAEDVDLFLRLAEIGRLANLPDIGLRYRVHPTSIGYTRRATQVISARKAAIDACARRELPTPVWKNSPDEDRDLFQTRLMWAWWALGDGHLDTARFYAKKAFYLRPFNPKAWKLIICTWRGH